MAILSNTLITYSELPTCPPWMSPWHTVASLNLECMASQVVGKLQLCIQKLMVRAVHDFHLLKGTCYVFPRQYATQIVSQRSKAPLLDASFFSSSSLHKTLVSSAYEIWNFNFVHSLLLSESLSVIFCPCILNNLLGTFQSSFALFY